MRPRTTTVGSRSAWAVFFLYVASSGACSAGADTDVGKYCNSYTDCPSGLICGSTTCTNLFRCIPARCACDPNSGFVNPQGDACLSQPEPPLCTCKNATCKSPLDSCGTGPCPGVCGLGEECDNETVCSDVGPCIGSISTGKGVCRPFTCLATLVPPLCGSPDAPCGEECCKPNCGAKKCGTDDRCGVSCGTCDPNFQCTLGQCSLDPAVLSCTGDLRAHGSPVAIEETTSVIPTPEGGTIADGIYDLLSIRLNGSSTFAELYRQAAIEFAAGTTKAELTGVADPRFFADRDSPHRLMDVTAEEQPNAVDFERVVGEGFRSILPAKSKARARDRSRRGA